MLIVALSPGGKAQRRAADNELYRVASVGHERILIIQGGTCND